MTNIDTIYGTFRNESKQRLDYAYFYEHTQICSLKLITDLISASRFLDIGSNIGLYAIYLSSLDGLKAIDAFEPAVNAYKTLAENVAVQPEDKITTHSIALSNQEATVEFAIYGELSGSNALVKTDEKGAKPIRIDQVLCMPLDRVITDRDGIFVCKIDVEGHELDALEGAKDYLIGNQGVLQIESFEHNRKDVIDLLASYGYDCIFRLQNDLYFTNLTDMDLRLQVFEVLTQEVSKSLDVLKDFKINRRRMTWGIRDALKNTGHHKDPLFP